jgi:hypothetical protein
MITTISRFAPPEPTRPYEPDKVALGTKLERHLRKKGWKKVRVTRDSDPARVWLDKKDDSLHSLTAAVRLQLHREGYKDV